MKEPITTEKVTDAALTKSVISSAIGIILCMLCLVGTTWAWYSLSVESGANMTEGANFDFDVAVTKNPTETTETTDPPEGTVSLDDDGTYTLDGGTYTVTLTKNCTAKKGFCKVEATKTGEETNTSYFFVDFTGEEPISFTVTGFDTLKLIPMLGTPTSDYLEIANNEIVLTPPTTLMALSPKKAVVEQEETTSEEDDLIDDEPDGKEIGDSTDGKGTTEPDEDDEIVNENEVPDEVPESPEPSENQGNPEPAEQPTETPVETTTQE